MLGTPQDRLKAIDKAIQKRGHRMTQQEYSDLTREKQLILKHFSHEQEA